MSTRREIEVLAKYTEKGIGLNIGCGDVQIGHSLGVDSSDTAKAKIVKARATNLPFDNNSQDYIVASACFEHIDKAPIITLREWLRVLKIGGIIAITVPDASYGMWAMTGDNGEVGKFVKKERAMEHLHAFDVTTLKLLFEFAGMKVTRCEVLDRRPIRPERTILCVGKKTEAYQSIQWDIIHFNWGLHDLILDTMDPIKKRRVQHTGLKKYEENLNILTELLQHTQATLIWGTTTPITEGSASRRTEDVKRYNEVALRVMKNKVIQVNDLYACVFGNIRNLQIPKNAHFKEQGYEILGGEVANEIRKVIGTKIPKVLLIGDSISLGYKGIVKRELEGEAIVQHLGFNGRSSSKALKYLPEVLKE